MYVCEGQTVTRERHIQKSHTAIIMSENDGDDDGHPFACFGESSGSGSDDGSDVDLDRDLSRVASNLAESRRLRDRSNAYRGIVGGGGGTRRTTNDIILPIIDESRFEVFDSGPSTGLGLRATMPYRVGDEVMREYAVMRVPNSQRATCREDAMDMHRNAVQREYDAMKAGTKSAFMELSSSCDGGGTSGVGRDDDDRTVIVKTPRGIYDTNAFRLGDDDKTHGGLFLTMARLNHSCRPNVNHFWSSELQMTLVFALRDIRIGEELCTTYGPSEWSDTRGRREYLRERFMFDCNCEMCLEGNDDGGDDRMMSIRNLQEGIALSSSLSSSSSRSAGVASAASASALESVDECLTLMKRQGICGGAFTKSIYHRGYAVCDASGDETGALSYLTSELKAVRDSEGMGSPNALEIENMLNNRGVACRAGG